MKSDAELRTEIQRIRRVSDMLCTAHAGLRDRHARRSLFLDVTLLGTSTWLIALVFVEPGLNLSLTPFGWNPQIWLGCLSVAVFFLSILQIKVDWKGTADAHKRSLNIYAAVKRECNLLLMTQEELSTSDCRGVFARYELASEIGIEIPEADFLKEKRRHLQKVQLSKHLDSHPGTSFVIYKLKRFWQDNRRTEK
jgi:hypothetical protein